MALNRIQGEMLEGNLLRNGEDLAVETDLLYLSPSTGRVGIHTNTPQDSVDIQGATWINNLKFNNSLITAVTGGADLVFDVGGDNISFSASHLKDVSDPIDPQDVVTLNYLLTKRPLSSGKILLKNAYWFL